MADNKIRNKFKGGVKMKSPIINKWHKLSKKRKMQTIAATSTGIIIVIALILNFHIFAATTENIANAATLSYEENGQAKTTQSNTVLTELTTRTMPSISPSETTPPATSKSPTQTPGDSKGKTTPEAPTTATPAEVITETPTNEETAPINPESPTTDTSTPTATPEIAQNNLSPSETESPAPAASELNPEESASPFVIASPESPSKPIKILGLKVSTTTLSLMIIGIVLIIFGLIFYFLQRKPNKGSTEEIDNDEEI